MVEQICKKGSKKTKEILRKELIFKGQMQGLKVIVDLTGRIVTLREIEEIIKAVKSFSH